MFTLHLATSALALASLAFSVSSLPSDPKASNRLIAGTPITPHVIPLHLSPRTRTHRTFSRRQDPDGDGDGDGDGDLGPVASSAGTAIPGVSGLDYSIEIDIAGSKHTCIIDTGSSDTWVAGEDFTCLAIGPFPMELPVEECGLGNLFRGDLPGEASTKMPFNITYGDGSNMNGVFGTADVRVAGVSFPEVQVGLADHGAWHLGDSVSSGLLGLGLKELTMRYDDNDVKQWYDPFVAQMAKQDLPAIFSVALSREEEDSYLAFGGVPDIETGAYVVADIQPATNGNFTYYQVLPDAIEVNNTESSAISREPPMLIVDTGTTVSYLPKRHADVINSFFTPPAEYSFTHGLYFTDCDAEPPVLGLQFGGDWIHNVKDYMVLRDIVDEETGRCATGITSRSDVWILGQSFMQGHLFVFDVDEDVMEIRIAERV